MQGLDLQECLHTLLRQRLPLLLYCLHFILSESASLSVGDLGWAVECVFKGFCHLYDVVLRSPLVFWISFPFFIQKLSLWGVWAAVRLQCRVTGLNNPSRGRMIWSEALIFGSRRQIQSNLIPELELRDILMVPFMLWLC